MDSRLKELSLMLIPRLSRSLSNGSRSVRLKRIGKRKLGLDKRCNKPR